MASLNEGINRDPEQIGLYRALGATRSQIRSLFLTEGAIAGSVGAIGGLGFGVLIARAMTGSIGQLIQGVYGIAQQPEDLTIDSRLMAAAIVMGVVTSIVAAFIPARTASRVDPVQALQKGKYQVLSAGRSRMRLVMAVVLAGAAAVALVAGRSPVAFYAGYVMAMLGALLFTPSLALWLTRGLRPALKSLRPVEGALAADSLIQAPRRTSASVAALMLSLTLVTAFAGMARASYSSIVDWMETTLNPDLFVLPTQSLVIRTIRFPAQMGDQVAAVPVVEQLPEIPELALVVQGQGVEGGVAPGPVRLPVGQVAEVESGEAGGKSALGRPAAEAVDLDAAECRQVLRQVTADKASRTGDEDASQGVT